MSTYDKQLLPSAQPIFQLGFEWLGDPTRRVLRHNAETACVLIFLLGEEG